MTMGLAGALLVFSGLWHATEWAMGGRNRDTALLVPLGLAYLVLGSLIVTLQFLPWVAWAALPITAAGMAATFTRRKTTRIRAWVTWAFIVIDIAILAALIAALAA